MPGDVAVVNNAGVILEKKTGQASSQINMDNKSENSGHKYNIYNRLNNSTIAKKKRKKKSSFFALTDNLPLYVLDYYEALTKIDNNTSEIIDNLRYAMVGLLFLCFFNILALFADILFMILSLLNSFQLSAYLFLSISLVISHLITLGIIFSSTVILYQTNSFFRVLLDSSRITSSIVTSPVFSGLKPLETAERDAFSPDFLKEMIFINQVFKHISLVYKAQMFSFGLWTLSACTFSIGMYFFSTTSGSGYISLVQKALIAIVVFYLLTLVFYLSIIYINRLIHIGIFKLLLFQCIINSSGQWFAVEKNQQNDAIGYHSFCRLFINKLLQESHTLLEKNSNKTTPTSLTPTSLGNTSGDISLLLKLHKKEKNVFEIKGIPCDFYSNAISEENAGKKKAPSNSVKIDISNYKKIDNILADIKTSDSLISPIINISTAGCCISIFNLAEVSKEELYELLKPLFYGSKRITDRMTDRITDSMDDSISAADTLISEPSKKELIEKLIQKACSTKDNARVVNGIDNEKDYFALAHPDSPDKKTMAMVLYISQENRVVVDKFLENNSMPVLEKKKIKGIIDGMIPIVFAYDDVESFALIPAVPFEVLCLL
ncbi:MAG: hypothetical protein QW728_07955 [Thermoplasmata archaeon]